MIRSSVVPQTIASETAQKTNWKNHFDSIVALERSMIGKLGWKTCVPSWICVHGPRLEKKNPPSCPITLPSGPPNANANPTAHQPSAAIEKLVRILAMIVPAFLPREKPISRNAKPACMNITRQAAKITHIVLTPTDGSSLPLAALIRSTESARAALGTSNSTASAPSGRTARYFLFIASS